ncbi:MAG: TolC family protein [Endomicrobium sp.]|jgi:outer membrane protein TolC|nr:TolC family protein [Endomicrobium sp.]
MKKVLFLIVLCFAFRHLYADGYEKILTEDSSVQTAVNINHEILIHSQSIDFAHQRIKESQSLYYPNIELNLNTSRFNNMKPLILAGNLSPTPVYLPGENKDVYFSTRLSAWQSIYSGGRIKTTNKLAEINMNKVKNEANAVKNNVINKVKTAFNACLLYKEKHALFLKQLENVKNGSVSERLELQRKADLTKFNYDKEILNLLYAIGLELDILAGIEGNLVPKIKKFDLTQCMLWAYQFRPEMQTTQAQESIDGLMVNLLSMQRFPTISIGVGQEWLGDRPIGDESSWYVSINANLPIFDGGGSFARVKQGKVNAREAALKRSKNEEQIKLQVSKALMEYDFWKDQLYKAGIAEKDASKASYTETELDIIYNLNNAYYALELAIGIQLDSF